MSFPKSLPRFLSAAPFLCLMVAHLEWPDIGSPLAYACPQPLGPGEGPVQEFPVNTVVLGQFGMEGGHEGGPLAA